MGFAFLDAGAAFFGDFEAIRNSVASGVCKRLMVKVARVVEWQTRQT